MFSILLSYLAYNSYEKLQAVRRMEKLEDQTQGLVTQMELQDINNVEGTFSNSESNNRLQ